MTLKQKIIYNKKQLKQKMLTEQPRCSLCVVKLVVPKTNKNFGQRSNAAIINGDRLICFQCRRLEAKKKDFANLPLRTRWKKQLDNFTGIPSFLRLIRKRWNQFIYFKIYSGTANGYKPNWLLTNQRKNEKSK
jgi:hypothetical protein